VSAWETLLGLIRRFEGCHLTPYRCPAGVWTCGWGSTGPDVFPGRPWTQEYADRRLTLDAARFASGAQALCPDLQGDRLAAIADFAYNLGLARLSASTLRRRLNAGNIEGARLELGKWVYAGGVKLNGLVARRAAEAALL
jgi:lysozyme